ncbi:MAG TPA: helix-turn-helix domain-containing protein [Dysgonomonas sp.]|uniref:helix-turn-helix domain-containing protein n=1 Tax=unclassified Dysgonomonas TaxID=2630389 RepID=UPI0025B8BC5E|nr:MULTISPECIES: helix-turn-helix domain-containing protein [unclassified Dysgonomonas]HML64720.1 helix-turn-helix domain-containing protein [Dysgonomonas sp.]
MFIERELFEKKLGYIIKRLDKIDKTLANMAKQRCYLDGELLYDNYDLCKLLNISKRTLQRYRSSGELPYHTLYQKTFYKESDISNFIRLNFGKDKGNDLFDLEERVDT